MAATLQCADCVLTEPEVVLLWQRVIETTGHDDETVTVRCVDETEMARLNTTYRHKKLATNVLTFSYHATATLPKGTEHDIVLCVPVATQEALTRGISIRDYIALLLVHAFLHAVGLDHEKTPEHSDIMAQAEPKILRQCGFQPNVL